VTTTAAIVTKEAELSHGKTRYLEAGSGPTIILIHGAGVEGGADDFRPAMEPLSEHYRVIAPDCLGWPPSDTYAYMDAFPYLTDHLREFQDALGLKSCHILGATMGGWLAGLLAYESPERVDKLIMTGNPGFHGAANDRLAERQLPTEERVRTALKRQMGNYPDSEVEELVQTKMRKMQEPGYFEAYASMMKTMANHDNRARFNLMRRLPHLTMPVLMIIGKGDPSFEHVDKLLSVTPNSKAVVIENGAHQVHYENVDEFAKAVHEFLG
jgi:pimeloyl-ACP methyl ester carboxylesterase